MEDKYPFSILTVRGEIKMDNIISLLKQKYSLLSEYNDRTSELLISEPENVEKVIGQREEIIEKLNVIMSEISDIVKNSDQSVYNALNSGIDNLIFTDSALQALNNIAVESNKLILTIGNKDKSVLERLKGFKLDILADIQTSNQDKQLINLYSSAIVDNHSIGNSTDRRI